MGGSTALQIFKNLSDLCDTEGVHEESEGNTRSRQAVSNNVLNLVFSVTTEGPVHELWLHFQMSEEKDFYMVCLGAWRTTLKENSLNFVRHLLAVLRWGDGRLKNNIVRTLQDL